VPHPSRLGRILLPGKSAFSFPPTGFAEEAKPFDGDASPNDRDARGVRVTVGQGEAEQTTESPTGRENDAVVDDPTFPDEKAINEALGRLPEKTQFATRYFAVQAVLSTMSRPVGFSLKMQSRMSIPRPIPWSTYIPEGPSFK
jgi:hypothetical protein